MSAVPTARLHRTYAVKIAAEGRAYIGTGPWFEPVYAGFRLGQAHLLHQFADPASWWLRVPGQPIVCIASQTHRADLYRLLKRAWMGDLRIQRREGQDGVC